MKVRSLNRCLETGVRYSFFESLSERQPGVSLISPSIIFPLILPALLCSLRQLDGRMKH
jgi:hypothetical protein